MLTKIMVKDNHAIQNKHKMHMETLEKWQALQSNWSKAFNDAKAAESALNDEVTEHLKNAVPAPSAESLDKVMHTWIAAAQSLTAIDEFINQHIPSRN